MRRPTAAERRELVAILLGGALGALARVALGRAILAAPGAWPWATLAVNVAGAGLLGAVSARLHAPDPRGAFLGPGLCGALTTFSTFQLELVRMLDAGRGGLAAGYAAASIAIGLVAVAAGGALARRGAPA